MKDFFYKPTSKTLQTCNLARFAEFAKVKPDQVYDYSIEDIGRFWDKMQAFLGVRWLSPFNSVLDESQGMAWTKWFPGGKINIEDNCIERPVDMGFGDKIALIFEGENGDRTETTYAQMKAMVHRATALLRSLGLRKGDRVAVYGPITPEITAAMFAIIRAGMVFVPLFSGFGEDALHTRLLDAGVKVVFTVDGFWHKGEAVSTLVTMLKTAERLPDLQKIVTIPRLGWPVPMNERIVPWPQGPVDGDESRVFFFMIRRSW